MIVNLHFKVWKTPFVPSLSNCLPARNGCDPVRGLRSRTQCLAPLQRSPQIFNSGCASMKSGMSFPDMRRRRSLSSQSLMWWQLTKNENTSSSHSSFVSFVSRTPEYMARSLFKCLRVRSTWTFMSQGSYHFPASFSDFTPDFGARCRTAPLEAWSRSRQRCASVVVSFTSTTLDGTPKPAGEGIYDRPSAQIGHHRLKTDLTHGA